MSMMRLITIRIQPVRRVLEDTGGSINRQDTEEAGRSYRDIGAGNESGQEQNVSSVERLGFNDYSVKRTTVFTYSELDPTITTNKALGAVLRSRLYLPWEGLQLILHR